MARAEKSLLRFSGLRASADDLGSAQKLRAAAGQRAALAGALAENLLTRRSHAHVRRLVHEPMSHQRASSLAANLLRTTQVATGRIVPLTGLLSLPDLGVVAGVEPLQTSARITPLDGDDLRRDPLEVRKATLASIVAKASPGVRFNEHIEGDGPTVFAHACKMGLEGIVSK